MVTAVAAAKHICLGPSRFRDLVAEGVFKRMPVGKYDLTTIREAYCLHMQRIAQGRAADGGAALSTQRAKLAAAQAQRAEFQNAQAQGQFVELSLMTRMLQQTFLVMREVALGTAGKIADGLTPYTAMDRAEIYRVIHGEICVMLESLADPEGLAAQAADQIGKKKASR